MIGMHRALRHMAWANQQVYAAVVELPWNALGSYLSDPEWIAGRILHHITDGAVWYVHCLGIERWRPIPIPESMDDIRGLATMLAGFDAQILSAADLEDELLEFRDDEGGGTVLRSTLLAQAVHHATEHRAQLIDALESRGHRTIALDDIDLWAFARFEREQAVGA